MLEKLPVCQRVVRGAHRVLLSGVRGEGKSPGDYRRIANWIGPPGCTVEEATFVPVGADKLPAAMSAWERYVNRDDAPDRLVQLAVLHAEFEALHPFLDGNGRLGRMLVPLFLWQCGLIGQPMFYVSAYFEARRDAYYEGLLAVSRDDDWTGWCRFFLKAVRAQAEENLTKARGILDLYEDMKGRVAGRDPLPVRHPHPGLDLRAPDLQQRRFRGQRGDPRPHGTAASGRAQRPRDPAGHEARRRPPGDHPRVPGPPERRRGTGRVLTAIHVRQIVLSAIFRRIWPTTGFGGHRWPASGWVFPGGCGMSSPGSEDGRLLVQDWSPRMDCPPGRGRSDYGANSLTAANATPIAAGTATPMAAITPTKNHTLTFWISSRVATCFICASILASRSPNSPSRGPLPDGLLAPGRRATLFSYSPLIGVSAAIPISLADSNH